MRLVSFDGLTLGQAMAEDDIPLDFVQATQVLPGQAGAFDHFGNDQVRGPLTIKRTYNLVATAGSDIGDLLDALRAKANLGRRWLVVEMTGGAQRGIWAKLVNVSVKHTIEHLNYVPVTLTFLATWPWFEDVNDIWYLDTGEVLDDGLTFDSNYSTRAGSGVLSITNNGGDAITRGLIIVKGGSTNPNIRNGANGYEIGYTGSITGGTTLYIDFGAQTVVYARDGDSAWANVTLGDDQDGFFRLEVGANLLNFTGGGTLEVHWAEAY